NPRTGTVVPPQDIPRVIQEAKKGRLEFRVDRTAIIHAPIGKVSFSAEQLQDNLAALLDAITKIRIEGLKGQLFRSIYLSSTMGPSAKVDLSKALTMKSE
ncbi:MAG: 50S ribosomal protein L1, partial [Chloroflexi bacterium]|nr:50S ribosomal protein L1 [Chloroflexota bacterium]